MLDVVLRKQKERKRELVLTLIFMFKKVDEWDVESGLLLRSIKMPRDSGPVSFVLPILNQKHLLW